MTLGSDRLIKAVAIFIAILAAALGADAGMAHAAGTRAPKGGINSLTTQFPLGRQKLCCSSKPRRQATKPARPPSTASQTTSVASSTAAAAPSPRSRTATASPPPLLGRRGVSVVAPLIVIGVVILGGAAAVLIGRLFVRRRRRARRMAHAGPATPGAPPAVSRSDAAPRPDAGPRADAALRPDAGPRVDAARRPDADPRADAALRPASIPRPDTAPPPDGAMPSPASIERRRIRSRDRSRAPLEPDPQPSPAAAGPPGSDAADEDIIADPLARLEQEILKQGATASVAAPSRRSPPGDGEYRLGQILYQRGRLDEAAAAWRLAASRQHPEAVSRLAELLKETGGTDARS